jgi:hypothetical protein
VEVEACAVAVFSAKVCVEASLLIAVADICALSVCERRDASLPDWLSRDEESDESCDAFFAAVAVPAAFRAEFGVDPAAGALVLGPTFVAEILKGTTFADACEVLLSVGGTVAAKNVLTGTWFCAS